MVFEEGFLRIGLRGRLARTGADIQHPSVVS